MSAGRPPLWAVSFAEHEHSPKEPEVSRRPRAGHACRHRTPSEEGDTLAGQQLRGSAARPVRDALRPGRPGDRAWSARATSGRRPVSASRTSPSCSSSTRCRSRARGFHCPGDRDPYVLQGQRAPRSKAWMTMTRLPPAGGSVDPAGRDVAGSSARSLPAASSLLRPGRPASSVIMVYSFVGRVWQAQKVSCSASRRSRPSSSRSRPNVKSTGIRCPLVATIDPIANRLG